MKHNPGVAKFWVKFQTGGTIDASQNVTSITGISTGSWDVNIDDNMSSANYVGVATAHDSGNTDLTGKIQSQTAAVLGISCAVTGDLTDPGTGMMVAGFGDL